MIEITIRPLHSSGECLNAHALECECFSPLLRGSLEAFQSRYKLYPNYFLAAYQMEKMIGIINGIRTDHADLALQSLKGIQTNSQLGDHFCVLSLAVHSQYRKQGIARQLLDRLIIQAKEDRLKKIVLMCESFLISFYCSAGFKLLGQSQSKHGSLTWYDLEMTLNG